MLNIGLEWSLAASRGTVQEVVLARLQRSRAMECSPLIPPAPLWQICFVEAGTTWPAPHDDPTSGAV
ncbi:hypothetical protein MHYP_G00161610 [Metynnis hypsauchen]